MCSKATENMDSNVKNLSQSIGEAVIHFENIRQKQCIEGEVQYCETNGDGHYIYLNPWIKKLYDLPDSFNPEGKFFGEIPEPVHERFHERFCANDKEIINNSNNTKHILEIHNFPNIGWKAYYQTWKAEKNESGIIIGTKGYGKPIDSYWIYRVNSIREKMKLESIGSINGCSLKLEDIPSLSKRESEVMFLLMIEVTPKAIGSVLGIGKSSTDTYIVKLKEKFGVHNLKALIEKAFHNSYHNHLMPSFFQRELSFLIK